MCGIRCTAVLVFLATQSIAWSDYVWQPGQDVCNGHQTGLDFVHASLVHNNLGGLGPDTGTAELRFNNITMVDGKSIDCVITNTSMYIRKDERPPTVTSKGNLKINIEDNNMVNLKFRLVYHETGLSASLDRFFVTALDVDANKKKKVVQWVRAHSFQAYYVTDTSNIRVIERRRSSGTKYKFLSKWREGGAPNPKGPFDLTHKQADHTVAFLYTYTSEFSLKLGVSWHGPQVDSGRNFFLAGTSSVACNAQAGIKPLSQSDFGATYRINWPGTYYLTHDIVFEPQEGPEVTQDLFPKPDSRIYPQLGGYFLGFFAAIVVQSPSVTFDCKGHSIVMSAKFHKLQRFFSIFELSSKPFISSAGPPQFSNGLLSPGDGYSASNVKIKNCRLGLSSHHGIHGNDNKDVILQDLTIFDFEVGGIHLNGATNVQIKDVDIGPSLQQTFSAKLSHAVFLDHLMHTLLSTNTALYEARKEAHVTIRGEDALVHTVLTNFHEQLKHFLEDGTGELAPVLGSGDDLPDGSAVYGIVVHKRGVAVHDFGACGAIETIEAEEFPENILLQDVSIHDLRLRPEQWTRTLVGGQQVMGPAGDVFPLTTGLDGDRYRGDVLMDAQLSVGALKHYVVNENISPEETSYYFGGTHMPHTILDWAAGLSSNTVFDLINTNSVKFECFGDAMSHVNKGVVGLRLAHVHDAKLTRVSISTLENEGKDDADPQFCSGVIPRYGGKDVFAIVFENTQDVIIEEGSDGVDIEEISLTSSNGGLTEAMHTVETRRLLQTGEYGTVKLPIASTVMV